MSHGKEQEQQKGDGIERVAFFVAENHHVPGCGKPPMIKVEANPEKGHYYGYFENEFGEQMIFDFDPKTEEAYVQSGDAGWDKKFKVDLNTGNPGDLMIDGAERLWLNSCLAVIQTLITTPAA